MRIKRKDIVFLILIFIAMFGFFYVAHPLILFDADDWELCSYFRRPLPIFGGYEGMKVFPETFIPMVSELAAYFVYPVMKDYLLSLAFVYAITGALFVTAYVGVFVVLIKKILNEEDGIKAELIGVLFLAVHFLVYKNDWYNNAHLFGAYDVTCFFHYIIPVLLNAFLVMYFMVHEGNGGCFFAGKHIMVKNGLLLLAIYLAVFSNMFSNIVLASYAGVELIVGIIEKKKALKELIFEKWHYVTVIVMWLVAVVIQAVDPRNKDAAKQTSDSYGVVDYAVKFVKELTGINKMCLLFFFVIVVMFVIAVIRKRGCSPDERLLLLKIAVSGVLTVLYLIILSAVSNMYYIGRSEVAVGYFFFGFVFMMILLAIAMRNAGEKESLIVAVLPFITFVIVMQSINSCKSYKDYNGFDLSKEQVLEISSDIVNQFLEADEDYETTMELHVVEMESNGNAWPYPKYVGDAISDTLVRHGVISTPKKTTVVYDAEKNKEFNLYFK